MSRIIPDSLHQQVVDFLESCHEGEWGSTIDRDALVTALAAAPVAQGVAPVPAQPDAQAKLKIELEYGPDEDDERGTITIVAYGSERDMRYLDARLKYLHSLEKSAPVEVAPAPPQPTKGDAQ